MAFFDLSHHRCCPMLRARPVSAALAPRPVRRALGLIGALLLSSASLPFAGGGEAVAQIVAPVPDSSVYTVEKDLPYRTRDGDTVRMDVFRPAARPSEAVPGVIFVHGGYLPDSVSAKDMEYFQSFGKFVTGAGVAGIVFSHGLSGPGTFQRSRRDVEAAVQYIRERASRLGLDRDRLCLLHLSAGGAFVAPFLADRPEWLRCTVLYYAVLRPGLMETLTGEPVEEPQRTGLNAFSHVGPWEDAPALFLAEAGKDEPAINEGLHRFRDQAVEAGWPVEYWTHPTGPHGFDMRDPSPRSRSILLRTRRFLKEQLVNGR
ncbi:MAG: alpha/beta hydrolase [Salinivenus sp.]